MVDTKQARWVYRVARNFCGCLFLRIGHFVMKQERGVIVIGDGVILLLLNFVII